MSTHPFSHFLFPAMHTTFYFYICFLSSYVSSSQRKKSGGTDKGITQVQSNSDTAQIPRVLFFCLYASFEGYSQQVYFNLPHQLHVLGNQKLLRRCWKFENDQNKLSASSVSVTLPKNLPQKKFFFAQNIPQSPSIKSNTLGLIGT